MYLVASVRPSVCPFTLSYLKREKRGGGGQIPEGGVSLPLTFLMEQS